MRGLSETQPSTTVGTSAVACRGIGKDFGASRILDDLDLDVAVGESLAVMGPSGSGKSTLLSILGLLAEPSRGELELFGSPTPTTERARDAVRCTRIAWVFQHAVLLGGRTVLDNVAFSMLLQGMARDEAEARAAAMLDRVGLGHRVGLRAKKLSGGEKQRVELARAMVRQTDLILCDEPTASLDRANAEAIIALLVEAKPAHTAVVVATHDARVAERCDRALLLADGRFGAP